VGEVFWMAAYITVLALTSVKDGIVATFRQT
jgi:hypothetical protein